MQPGSDPCLNFSKRLTEKVTINTNIYFLVIVLRCAGRSKHKLNLDRDAISRVNEFLANDQPRRRFNQF